jgi:hypothetical protein
MSLCGKNYGFYMQTIVIIHRNKFTYREYYMGEGGGFPWVRAVVSLVNPELPVV